MHIQIRDAVPDDAEALAEVLVSSMRAAFQGIVPDHCLEWPDSAANWRRALNQGFDPGGFLHVAVAENGLVVGYAMGGLTTHEPDYPGELIQVSVLPDYHGQGIGRLLVRDVAQQHHQQGTHSMCVRVLKENPNRIFYERLGGQFVSERPYDWDGVLMTEYTYGWKNTDALLQTH